MEKFWYAIYTNSRAEKKVEERLIKEGFEAYCPTYTTVKQCSDRKKKVILPLIPSYIFAMISERGAEKQIDTVYKILQFGIKGWDNFNIFIADKLQY